MSRAMKWPESDNPPNFHPETFDDEPLPGFLYPLT
jgi:hypothetical protein